MQSRTDYILGTDICLFVNISVRDPRHNSYHGMVLGCLHSASLREKSKYLRRRKRLPLRPLTAPTREDRIFVALWSSTPKLRAREARKNAWILAKTCRLVNKRVFALRYIAKYQALILEVGPCHKGKLAGGQKMASRGGGSGGGETVGVVPPTSRVSLAPDQGVVQGCG